MQTIFSQENTFQTIFSLHFVMKIIFMTILKNIKALFIHLITKKNSSCVFIHMEKSHLNENKFTLYKSYAVLWRVFNTEEV